MLLIAQEVTHYCPYRDCLGIDIRGGQITWYQLLAVTPDATQEVLLHRWSQRRALVAKKRAESGDPVWDSVLDELDRAFACLSHKKKRADYDDDLERRRQQTSLLRRPPVVHDSSESPESESKKEQSRVNGAKNIVRTRFEPLREVGRGQQGTKVFEAYEFTLKRTVAVKCLEKSVRTATRVRNFLDEAKFLASVSHPNLVEVHLVQENSCFFVMEFLPKSVRDHFQVKKKSGAAGPDDVTDFLRQALAVLQCLHDHGVVHGAITLKSFLATEAGIIKLIDAPGCTRTGLFRSPAADQMCVAPELLSPETFGEPRVTVDLYMVGHAALDLLAGEKLPRWFRKMGASGDPDQKEWLRWHASPLENISSLEQFGIPAELGAVIEKLCQKQVVDRYQTANDALSDLVSAGGIQVQFGKRADSFRTSDHFEAGPRPGARELAGLPPLAVSAKCGEEHTTDLLTILQDPALLWQTLRTNKVLQTAAASAVIAILILLFLPGGTTTPKSNAVVKTTADQEQKKPIVNSARERGKEGHSETTAGGDSKQKLDLELKEKPTSAPAFYELEPVPVVAEAPRRKAPDASASPRADSAKMQFAVASPFLMDIERQEQFEVVKEIMKKLGDAKKNGTERKQLLKEARMVAPNDPRPPFIFAAVYGFNADARKELHEAIRLSAPHFTQPFRMHIESLLRASSNDVRTADTVLAELVSFRARLNSRGLSRPEIYDWEWIGRVIGYLEAMSSNNASVKTILAATTPRLFAGNPPEAQACIERGRQSILRSPTADRSPQTLFPVQPKIEVGLCMETLIPENRRIDVPSAATALARAARLNDAPRPEVATLDDPPRASTSIKQAQAE